MWIQFCLKHPEFAKDKALKGAIGIQFIEENLFTEAKKRDIISKGADIVEKLMNIRQPEVDDEGKITMDGMYFDPKFLVEKYMNFTEEDLKLNAKYKKERREQLSRIADAVKRLNKSDEGESGGGFGGGSDFGGGPDMDLGGGAPEEPGMEEMPDADSDLGI